MNKLNDIFCGIAHLAVQALVTDDGAVKRQALADIVDATSAACEKPLSDARLTEAEMHEAATEEPSAFDRHPPLPAHVITHDEPAPEAPRKYTRNRISYPDGLALTIERDGRKLVGVISSSSASVGDDEYPFKYYADVYENGDLLFSINSCPRGKSFLEHVLRKALHGAAMQLTHHARNRQNRKARRAAAQN